LCANAHTKNENTMRKPQITDGEWQRDKKAAFRIHGNNNRQVAACGGRSSNLDAEQTEIENEANARFIAASKKMAEALEVALSIVETSNMGYGCPPWNREIEQIKSALIAAGYEF